MKFLTDGKCNEQNRNNTCNILSQLTMHNNKHNTIKPNDVKLLTNDNAGIDFLTLCAMKKSEEEMSSEAVPIMDTTYIPAPKPIKDLFDFTVPNIEVINSLSFLTIEEDNLTQCKDYENNLSINCKNNKDENIHDINNDINVDDNFWGTIQNERNNGVNTEIRFDDNDKIRFEDILDDSSDSNETTISYLNQQIMNVEVNSINTNEASTSDIKEDNKIIIETRTKSSILEDLVDSTIFENILNVSFSSDDDLEGKDDVLRNTDFPNPSNVFTKNAEKINVMHKTNVDTFHNENNVAKTQNLSASMSLAKPHQMNKFVSFIDEVQDIDFNSDIDISEFVKDDSNKSKLTRNSKTEESLLSITQAIDEIAQVKKNLDTSRRISKEESIEEESSGWISVNIKNEINAGKSDKSSRTDTITLSNIHCNSAAEPHINKPNLILLDDSDDDFIITEDNVKKCNELESCYFRNSSKDSENDISCMPSTSRNSEIRNDHFSNILKNLKTKSICSDNASKSWKPSGVSTPKSDRRPKLSLKRSNAQQGSDKIDLNIFKASDKYVNNAKDKNILKSSSTAPKQIFSLNEKIARKRTRMLKHENNARNEFIDDEAKVDSDASSDEIIIDDEDIADFVSYTQIPQDQNMHAHYLQTIKSPMKRPGAFHFREPRSPDSDTEIYSQFSPQMQDSYLNVRMLSNLLQALSVSNCASNRSDFFVYK